MRSLCTSLALIGLLVLKPAVPAQDGDSARKTGVRITFLPPPMEGTLSLGIYDQKGKLVRVLAREVTQKDFTVGLNGFITHWDGRDDTGVPLPAGTYEARGYSVGAVQAEGIALHGNDWITEDDAPRPTGLTDLRRKTADEIEAVLQTRDGAQQSFPIRFETQPPAQTIPDDTVKIAAGRIELTRDGETRSFPLGEGATAIDATLGTHDRLWVIVQTPGGREVRAFTLEGEFLRRLAYDPSDPQPQRILAAQGSFATRWSEQIALLEENGKMQRVRSLALPRQTASGEAPLWETVLEKSIWRGESFDAIKDLLVRPGGKPFTPEKEFIVRLINNPLLKDEATTARVTIGFNERGSFLQTLDGLPLRGITGTPHLKWTVIGREGSGKLLTIFQGDGAVVEEFKVRRLADMMSFDAGDYEWAGK